MMRQARLMTVAATLLALAIGAGTGTAEAALVGYWDFDAGDATDLSGNSNDGVVGAAVTFTSQTPFGAGQAVQSTKTGTSTITVANSASLQSLNDQLTISFWMKADAAANNNWFRIFRKGTKAQYDQSWMVNRYSNSDTMNVRVDTNLNPSTLYPGFNQNIAYADYTPILNDQWHHLVFIMDNGQWRKYVDGAPQGSGSYTHNNGFANTRPLQMLTGNYAGLLDDVAVWSQPLSALQVKAMAEGITNPLNAAWRIDGVTYDYTGSILPYPTSTRNDDARTKLTDAVLGTTGYDDGTWVAIRDPLGYQQDNGQPQPQIDFDLGAPEMLGAIRIDYLVNHPPSIFEPDSVVVEIYGDAGYTTLLETYTATAFSSDAGLQSLTMDLGGGYAQYVRLSFFNDQEWTWLGEVTFFGTIPEPGSFALLGLGAVCLVGCARRRRSTRQAA